MSYITKLKEKLERGGEKICIYPMGLAAERLLNKLHEADIHVDFFSDKNEILWGNSLQNIPCISWSELAAQNQEDLTVIVESEYYPEIKKDLQKLGIKNIMRVIFQQV